MRTSNSLLGNFCYKATIVLAGIKANGNFNDASLERLHSVSGVGINGVLSSGVASTGGRSPIFLTARPLRQRKVLPLVRSSANHRNIQLRLRLDSAKLRIL